MRYARGADRNIEISKLISIQLLSMNLTRLQISFSNNSNGLLVPDKWIRDQPFVKGQYSSFQDLCTIVPSSVFFFFFLFDRINLVSLVSFFSPFKSSCLLKKFIEPLPRSRCRYNGDLFIQDVFGIAKER